VELQYYRDIGYPFNLKRLESNITDLKAYMAKTAGLAIPTPGAAPVQTARTTFSPRDTTRSFR